MFWFILGNLDLAFAADGYRIVWIMGIFKTQFKTPFLTYAHTAFHKLLSSAV